MNFTPLCLLEEQGICILAKGTDTLPLGREANLCVYTPSLFLSLPLRILQLDLVRWHVRMFEGPYSVESVCTNIDTEMCQ